MNEDQWIDLMNRVGISDNLETFSQLQSSYNQKHRHYHSVHHIDAVLKHLKKTRHLANDYEALETALWFHDAIYKIFSSTNELDSANWAQQFLQDNQVNNKFISKVHGLIMVTLHNAIPQESDEQLMVDIDLSILGTDPATYQLFEKWIRKEYQLIPAFIYKKKRKAILSEFLQRDRIYSHEYFYEKLETKARINMKQAIQNL
ncbi:MAG: N-methyl-D-aspartate receptor NMDAR2C subunit [Marinicellaceae bacterium]